ncbi:MAG: asparagine synthase-related protein [Omnitrophica WOR_2 bacterium]
MNSSWLIRWRPGKEFSPQVAGHAGGAEDSFISLPDVHPSQEGGFVIFAGYLFNSGSPAEAIACAYRGGRADLVDELRGGFALAIWDAYRRQLIAGRDAMGFQPLYYRWDGRLFLLSPDLDLLLAQAEAPRDVNRVVLAEYLACAWPAAQRDETFYAGIQRLPCAHRLTIDKAGLSIERYWDPLPPGFKWARNEELEQFIPALENAVGRCLAIGADSLALSGGFDSVSIAIIAAGKLRGEKPVQAVSLRFSLPGMDEGETQAAAAHALGMPQIIRSLDECLEGVTFVEASLALSRGSPLPVLSQWQVMYDGMLRLAASRGLSRMMMGTGGDEMLNVDLSYGADRLATLDLAGLWSYYRAMQRTSPFSPRIVARVVMWEEAGLPVLIGAGGKVLKRVSPPMLNLLRGRFSNLPAWLAPGDAELRQLLEERQRMPDPQEFAPGEGPAPGEDESPRYVRRLRRLLLSPLMLQEHEQSESWARRAGFTLLYPFLDRDVVGLALRMHPKYLLSGGRAKTPLRRLVAERLPQVSLPSKKVDFTLHTNRLMRAQGQAAWRALGGARRLNELGLVEPARLNRFMDDYFAGKNGAMFRAWQVLSAETWLRGRG